MLKVTFFCSRKAWRGLKRKGQGTGELSSLVIKSEAVRQTL